MKKILLLLLICGISKFLFCQELHSKEIEEIIEDIRILNLIKGLELDKSQAEFIVEKSKEAEKIKEEYKKKISEIYENEGKVFEELRNFLIKNNGEIPKKLKKEVPKVEHKLKRLKYEYNKEIEKIASQVKEKLYPHQIYALQEYKPCMIPPASSKVGQADNTKWIGKFLERIKKMPLSVYNRKKEEIAERWIEMVKRHLPKGYMLDTEKEKERIISIFEKVRSLPDIEFNIKKKEFVEEMKKVGPYHLLSKMPIDVSVKIEKFLLSKRARELIKELYLNK